jgi:hypothetical protein
MRRLFSGIFWSVKRYPGAVAVLTLALVAGLAASPLAELAGAPGDAAGASQQAAGRSPDDIWQVATQRPEGAVARDNIAGQFTIVTFNKTQFDARLAAVGRDTDIAPLGIVMSLPMPDGTFDRFLVRESPMLAPELAAAFPEIKTYSAQGIDDPTATARFGWTAAGFHSIVLSGDAGTSFIDPYAQGNTDTYVVFNKADYRNTDGDSWACLVAGEHSEALHRAEADLPLTNGGTLRTYRLALAATAEYTAAAGGTKAGALARMTTTMNRVNGIYERELAVRMTVATGRTNAGTEALTELIFTDQASDGYTNSNGGSMLAENQTKLDAVIGTANYDIGHVFSTGGGGVAYLGSPCNSNFKAGGVTGSTSPTGDAFDVDYVAHEMGHQFGGNHTFNAGWPTSSSETACTTGSGGARNASTAYEVGSGVTIQAYAGICGVENLQRNSIDRFHVASLNEMATFLASSSGGSTPGCGSTSSTGNAAPTINALSNYSIPIGTPFVLSASASDSSDAATLTYAWDQYDLGTASTSVATATEDSGNKPLFRSYAATTRPHRTFPSMQYVLSSSSPNAPPSTYSVSSVSYLTGETMPTTSRTMNFQLTVRDNRSGGGAFRTAGMTVTTVASAGPFTVTAPASTVAPGALTVAWNVAGTNGGTINATDVRILLSIDGGETFQTELEATTPNDGSATVTIPNVSTSRARIKIEALGNIFFDVNDADFTITGTNTVPGAPTNVSGNAGNGSVIVSWNQPNDLGGVALVGYQVQVGTSATGPFIDAVGCASAFTSAQTSCTASGLMNGTPYFFRVAAINALGRGAFSSTSSSVSPTVGSSNTVPDPPTNVAGTGGNAQVSVSWTAPSNNGGASILSYKVQGALSAGGPYSDALGCNVSGNPVPTNCTITGLTNGSAYFFKVAAANSVGQGAFSAAMSTGVTPVAPCAYTLGSDTASVDRLVSNETVTVTTTSACAWTASVASNSTSMLSISSPTSSTTGSGTVSYQVSQNPSTTASRTGTMTIAGQTFTVTQSADSYTVDITVQQGSTPIAGAFVALIGTGSARAGAAADPSFAADGTRRKFGAVSSASGIARFRGVVPGTFAIRAHSGGRSVTSGTITVSASVLSATLSMTASSSALTTLGAYGSQTGTIVADGQSGVFYLNTTAIPSLYRTTDHGGNWSPVTLSSDDPATGLDASSTAAAPTTSGRGGEIATIVGNKVWYSFDFGLTWASMTNPLAGGGPSTPVMYWAHIADTASTVSHLFVTNSSTATVYVADMSAATPSLAAMASSYKTNATDLVAVGNGDTAPVIAVFDTSSGATKFWAVDATPAGTDTSMSVASLAPTLATNGTTALGAGDVTFFKIGGPATGVEIGTGGVRAPNTVLIYSLTGAPASNVRFSTCTASACSFPLGTVFKNLDDSTSTTSSFANPGIGETSMCSANFGAVGSVSPLGGAGSISQCWLTVNGTSLEVRYVLGINNNTGLAFDAAYDGSTNLVLISGDGQHGASKSARMTTGTDHFDYGVNRPYFAVYPNIAGAGTGSTTGGIAVQGITSAVIRQSLFQPSSTSNMASVMSFSGGGRTIGSTDAGTTWFTLVDRGGFRMDWWDGATAGSQWLLQGSSGAGNWLHGAKLAAASDFSVSTSMTSVLNGSAQVVGPSDFAMSTSLIGTPGVPGIKGISGTDYAALGSWDGSKLRIDLTKLTNTSGTTTMGTLIPLLEIIVPRPSPDAGSAAAPATGTNAGTIRLAYCPSSGSASSMADVLFVATAAMTNGESGTLRKLTGIGAGAALSTPSFSGVTSTTLTLPSGSNLRDIAVNCANGTVWLARSNANTGGGGGGGTPVAGILKSTDGGSTIAAITMPTNGNVVTAVQNIVAIDFNKTTTTTVVAVSRAGDVLMSTDSGGTWSLINDTSQAACVGQTTQCGRGFGGEEPGSFAMPPAGASDARAGDGPYTAAATTTHGVLGSGAGLFSVALTTPDPPGTIAVSSTVLNYSGVNTGGTLSPITGTQTITVTASGNSDIAWSATANQSWVQIANGSGTGSGTFTVSMVNPSNVLAGVSTAQATITVTATNASNSPRTVTVNLTLQQSTQLQPPYGAFDTPVANATVQGSIAVTGWALDDVGIDRVEIWRDLITNDPAPPFRENGHPADGKVFIANGTFSDGSRPDVEGMFTTAPFKHRSGWGYLMLTWGLPNSNGTFVLTAIAWDKEGRPTVLGTKTITVANSTATKPFGSIDVPAYGATFTGNQFTFGWALTPAAGCNVAGGQQFMTIDSAPPNFPITYGGSRTDIAASFPSFSDSNAAGGAVVLNSTNYTNGAHAIGWLVYDSCGNGEGIGSRFFQILNSGARARMAGDADAALRSPGSALRSPGSALRSPGSSDPGIPDDGPANAIVGRGPTFARAGQSLDTASVSESTTPLWLVRGIGRPATVLERSATVWLSQTGRIEIHATDPRLAGSKDPASIQESRSSTQFEAYLAVNGTLEPLPMGSSFDKTTGTFMWQPVAGFLGAFPIRIVRVNNGAGRPIEEQWTTRVVVSPGVDDILLQVDAADARTIEGWSLDPLATKGSGIGAVHVWATKKVPGLTFDPFFLGQAVLGQSRDDVGETYGAQFNASGYKLTLPMMEPGTYEVVVYAWSERTAQWEAARVTTVVVR